ncbi:MAG: N-acetyltransferase [Rhodospirillaceae bacterium]|nr:N-acetyltransferase [Rhodospirillaceae bacterium]
MFHLTTERPDDAAEIEALLDRAFGHNRFAKTSYRYRLHVAPVRGLSWVARNGSETAPGAIVGSIRYWPVLIGRPGELALLLGPLAVEPARHGEGIGAALTFLTLDLAAWAGQRLVLLVGDHGYYRRFGFHPAAPHGFSMPGELPERLLMKPLVPVGLGTKPGVIYSTASAVVGDVEANADSSRHAAAIRRIVG